MSTETSTATWAARNAVGLPLGLFIYGILVSMLSSPGLVAIYAFYPEAMPFAWLALIITLINAIGYGRQNGIDDEIIERMQSFDPAERREYFINLMFIAAGIMSVHIGGIAAVSAVIALTLGYPLAGIAVAISLPVIDAYLGRNYNIGFGTFGRHLSNSTMRLFSLVTGISPDSTKAAARDARSVL